jgi:hypothetical protein
MSRWGSAPWLLRGGWWNSCKGEVSQQVETEGLVLASLLQNLGMQLVNCLGLRTQMGLGVLPAIQRVALKVAKRSPSAEEETSTARQPDLW